MDSSNFAFEQRYTTRIASCVVADKIVTRKLKYVVNTTQVLNQNDFSRLLGSIDE